MGFGGGSGGIGGGCGSGRMCRFGIVVGVGLEW